MGTRVKYMQSKKYETTVDLLLQVKRYVDEHLDGSITGQSVAEHFNCPYMTFRRYVQEVGGFSIHDYIRLRRAQKGAALLREGKTPGDVAGELGYQTLSGFNKAFFNAYHVSSSEYARTCGQCMMVEPELAERPGFYVVGYLLEAEKEMTVETWGAFWIGQHFPYVSEDEYGKIGGGPENVAIWVNWENKWYYVIGPPVEKVNHVPDKMRSRWIPGGQFLVFKVPAAPNNTVLHDHVCAVWYYAYRQYLPKSDYVLDEGRIPYEFYLNSDNLIYVPVKRRGPPNEGI